MFFLVVSLVQVGRTEVKKFDYSNNFYARGVVKVELSFRGQMSGQIFSGNIFQEWQIQTQGLQPPFNDLVNVLLLLFFFIIS